MRICGNCFNDKEIKQYILTFESAEENTCDYCGCISKCIEITELLDFFLSFISIFEKNDNGKSLVEIIKDDWNLLSPTVNNKKVLDDILGLLNIKRNISDANEKVVYTFEISECVEYWETLKDELKWNRRFLTDSGRLLELGWDKLLDNPLIVSQNTSLYRARIHVDGKNVKFGDTGMGAPFKECTIDGRANPKGIPYLYLCKEKDTTLYETRAVYGDIVSLGTFRTIGKIEIIDFAGIKSPFNNDTTVGMVEFAKGELLRKRISNDLSKPMRRFDSELEYIPTQFICEFIREITGAEGIQFNSSLYIDGTNVVLFSPKNATYLDEEVIQINKVDLAWSNL